MRHRSVPPQRVLVAACVVPLLGSALAGCAAADPANPEQTTEPTILAEQATPSRSPEPDLPAPEHHLLTFDWDGEEREYRLDVPDGYDPAESTPLVMVLHGGAGTAAGIRIQSRMADFAQQHDVLVAYPQGVRQIWAVNPDATGRDDVGFLTALVDELIEEWNVAPGQVYATGWSNGAEMVYRLAVAAPEVFAAVAPVAGNFIRPPEQLDSAAPVSMVGFVGLSDRAVGNAGSLDIWRELADCGPAEPAVVPGADHVTRIDAQCRDGSEVVEYRMAGVGHVWPSLASHGFSANDAMWEFFTQHARTS